jgi:trimethylamine--corrinoid protein Co-methyltransferase
MQRYRIVTQVEIERIHETSLKIMENVGVVFSYDPAREILARHGARVDGQTVFFPNSMVEANLKTVPSSFTIYARDPAKNVTIDTQHAAYAGPYGAPYVRDMDNGRRFGSLDDFIKIVKLCQDLKNIDIQSHISCEPCDTDSSIRHKIMTYNTLKYSDKPLMGSVLGYEASMESIEMAAMVFGGLDVIKKKPVIASIPCTLTPLSYDDKMAGALIAYAETGQPQLVNSLSISGATTPSTIAGTVSLQNAEVLAGIVLTQCVNPGTPVIYSASSSNADMRAVSLVIGSPEDAIFSLINGDLAKFYNIPCRISGALTDSKIMDSQAAYESAFTLIMAQMAGGNFILHAAGIVETYNCVSFEKLMTDNEVIGMIKRIEKGVEVNDDTLAYDVIKEVGPQGEFITHDHTLKYFRDEFYMPFLSDRKNAPQWEEEGEVSVEQRANEKWKKMLDCYEEPKLPADVDAALRKFIEG